MADRVKKRWWSGSNQLRLILTLELAVMLPAAVLIYVNFRQLKSIERDKVLESASQYDFDRMLAESEQAIGDKMFALMEEARRAFPSPDTHTLQEEARELDLLLARSPWLAYVYRFDDARGFLLRYQTGATDDRYLVEERERLNKTFGGWFAYEAKSLLGMLRERRGSVMWHNERTQRKGGPVFLTHAIFPLPRLAEERVVVAGAAFDPDYIARTFFPQALAQLVVQNAEGRRTPLAMILYASDAAGRDEGAGPSTADANQVLAASAGWRDGPPERSRNLDEVFRGISLGIKFQGTSVDELSRAWIQRNILVLAALSVLLAGGLYLTYRSVTKQVELARLKSDFVSNVSHELRTPLSLIRLYAETLELRRVTSPEKMDAYYRIIRKESERLSALINNILDFSRIEAGRKEYDFRETDLGELVRNTLEAYRYQIEEQGFAFEQRIDPLIPAVRVDREAIARSLVNLLNNALKYSAEDKFLGVTLHQAEGVVKLEVLDHGIGIARSEQAKIFEKFYRVGDPLVHDTKGSGLGLSLVRHIARAHGGEVEVESAPGRGSRFTLSLPLPTAPRPSSAADTAGEVTA
jgi:signal transduction histidine kinase